MQIWEILRLDSLYKVASMCTMKCKYIKMLLSTSAPFKVYGSLSRNSPDRFDQIKTSMTSTMKPFLKEIQQPSLKDNVSRTMKLVSRRLLDAFVDSTVKFVDQPLPSSQSNFAPVEEVGEAVTIGVVSGKIPVDFPEGVYVRNGANPLFGGRKTAVSFLGSVGQIWVEGEGMLHALYFEKDSNGKWTISYNNKFVQSDTYKLERQRNKPALLPNLEGSPLAVLFSNLFNQWMYELPSKLYHNIGLFEHSGKIYTTTDYFLPLEVDLSTLGTRNEWDVNGQWHGSFTSHPKRAPSGELVTMGIDGRKPYCVIGVISADGEKVLHKADLQLEKCLQIHEVGVTQNYNVVVAHPLVADMESVIKGGPLIWYDEERITSRIAVMPRYGDVDSITWFNVQPNCTFHLVNCFEDGNEVVVRGCSSRMPIFPGPDRGEDKLDWYSRGFRFNRPNDENDHNTNVGDHGYLFHHVHEWRLNMVSREVKEQNLTGNQYSMDFPFINEEFTGLKHKYAYTQVIDSNASSASGMTKYGGLAKLYFDEDLENKGNGKEPQVKMEYHQFPDNTFCTGSVFVAKPGGIDEDDGWVVTFVHNEDTDVSQAYIVDAKKLESEPTAIITLEHRVPYGHHGLYVAAHN